MVTTRDLLAAVKRAQGIPSNYRLCRELGVTDQTVSNWQNGRTRPDDATAVRLAELAGLDPAEVLASLYAERASEPAMRKLWAAMAKRLHHAAALALTVILSLWISGGPDGAAMAATPGEAATCAPLGQVGNGSIHWRGLVSALLGLISRSIRRLVDSARPRGADLAACPC